MKIEVKNVTKSYGKKKALDQVSFVLEQGKIYGLLGRNGAGKTTLMQTIAGHIMSTSGDVFIDNQRPFENQFITESICLINESGNFKKGLKVKETLKVCSLFYPNWDWKVAERLLEEFSLEENLKVKALSKGMESALGIIVGLAAKAPITIFDEPYIGLDAAHRKRFYELLLEEYENHPRTIILSTHLVDEVSRLFEEVLIFQRGKLVLKEDAEKLRDYGFVVQGSPDSIDLLAKDHNVIHRKSFAGQETAVIFSKTGGRKTAETLGLKIETLPVQELMIHLTSSQKGGKAV
ncbi:MAG TPA: ABC transporter ATP-binding protein [Bacillus sp. (in: firmicutes)]|uniref:ABC transporter ATP-binding protein n=1 Tax=Bacillus litorisediminis TaxID=2922713 RepID=UPI001FAC7CF8|nr:ABC transporter ATP-binding protein [Bacillus litorisediminis]HWO77023.1 ABC transporter ATP-binding protein [Bacillus sp. (in: firmicutes)]